MEDFLTELPTGDDIEFSTGLLGQLESGSGFGAPQMGGFDEPTGQLLNPYEDQDSDQLQMRIRKLQFILQALQTVNIGSMAVEILTTLVDEMCEEVAFETHYFAHRKGLDALEPPGPLVRDPMLGSAGAAAAAAAAAGGAAAGAAASAAASNGLDVFGNSIAGFVPESFICPCCGRLCTGPRYAQHLMRCITRGSRNRHQPTYVMPSVPFDALDDSDDGGAETRRRGTTARGPVPSPQKRRITQVTPPML